MTSVGEDIFSIGRELKINHVLGHSFMLYSAYFTEAVGGMLSQSVMM